jgi:hypothetical protein
MASAETSQLLGNWFIFGAAAMRQAEPLVMLLLAACCVLRAACCLLLAACRLLLAACCVLPAA